MARVGVFIMPTTIFVCARLFLEREHGQVGGPETWNGTSEDDHSGVLQFHLREFDSGSDWKDKSENNTRSFQFSKDIEGKCLKAGLKWREGHAFEPPWAKINK